jgi:tetratricopeptide (TPR) repeat protein
LRNVVEKAQENAAPGLTFVHGIDAIGAAGTLPWMAPEQFEGRASVQSDIYSFGVVLYQLANGHLPITTGENGNWHKAHQEMAPQALDHPLWPLIDRCLAKDPTTRFGGSKSNEGFNDMRQEVVALWQQHLPARRLPTPPASDELEAGDLNDKAISLSYLGLHDEALRLYQRVVKLKPDHAPTYLNAGVAFYDKGDIENARKACRKALKLDPSMAAAHYNYGMICKMEGRLEEAERCFRKAIQLEPDQHNAHEKLGIALSETGRHQEAVDLISKAIEYDPLYGGFHYTMGVVLENARHHQEALKCYEEAVRLAPGNAMYHYGLGNGYRFVGDMQRAVAAWMRTLELDHAHESARFNLGRAYEQNNDRATAYRYYCESTEVVPEFAQVYYNLGLMLANAGLFGEGADAFEKFVQYGADNPDLAPHMQKARSYVNSMREDEAQAQQQMIHPEAVYNRGLAYLNLGRLEEAREWLEKSLGMKPDYPHALCGLGIYHENLNEFAKAAEYYQKSIDVDPSYTIAWNNLGWARYQRQDYDGARQAYNRFIEVGGEFPDWVERAHQMLAEIDQKQNAAN